MGSSGTRMKVVVQFENRLCSLCISRQFNAECRIFVTWKRAHGLLSSQRYLQSQQEVLV